jgi:hypothetical protein
MRLSSRGGYIICKMVPGRNGADSPEEEFPGALAENWPAAP